MSFREMASAVAGVTMGPDGAKRQQALEILRRRIQEAGDDRTPRFLKLVPEPTNQWDRDAIKVLARVPELAPPGSDGWFQIGYVRNGETFCSFCETVHPAYPKGDPPTCSRCKQKGKELFERRGTATRLQGFMQSDPHGRFYAVVTEITGGDQVRGKNHLGCNILICKVLKKDAAPRPAPAGQTTLPDVVERRAPTPAQRARAQQPTPAPAAPVEVDRAYDWSDFEDA